MADIIEQVDGLSESLRHIEQVLSGDDFRHGMVVQVKINTEDIEMIVEAKEKTRRNGGTMINMAWVFFAVAIVLSISDRAVLISDIRHQIEITPFQALAVSLLLGLSAKAMIAAAVAIFVSRSFLDGDKSTRQNQET